MRFTPRTFQQTKDGLSHVVNGYIYSDRITLCGLDASEWVGRSFAPPTCEKCQEALRGKEIPQGYTYPIEGDYAEWSE